MELMRHSDVRLTMTDYNDSNLLPLARELEKVPSLKSSLISSLKAGKTCPSVSIAGKSALLENITESSESQGFRVELASGVQACPSGEMADREGFEPSIPSRVYSLSRGALSTTQPPVQLLRGRGENQIS